jgi:hypothetical protein
MNRRPVLGLALLVIAGAGAIVAGLGALGWVVGGIVAGPDAKWGNDQ